MSNKKLEECLDYFSGKRAFEDLFQKIRKKYESLGRLGGSVILAGLSETERTQLEGFFGKSFGGSGNIKISTEFMKRVLEESRFAGLTWEEILEAYFGEALTTKEFLKQRRFSEKECFFREVIAQAGEGEEEGRDWLIGVLKEQGPGYQLLMKQYREDRENLKEALVGFFHAVAALPMRKEKTKRLPVFAAGITGDPHYFDEGTLAGRILFLFLEKRLSRKRGEGMSGPEWKNGLLFEAGILKDDLSNYTLAYGVHGRKRDGRLHEGLEGFYKEREPVQITLAALGDLIKLWAGNGGPVYIVENPAVFSAITEQRRELAAVCTNGQPRLASLVLLDQLSREERLLYAGDFDPEGLLIAQSLKWRYGDKLQLWHYEREYYDRIVSAVALSEQRLKKLERVKEEGLLEIKEAMLRKRCAAYQENMLEIAYLPDISV